MVREGMPMVVYNVMKQRLEELGFLPWKNEPIEIQWLPLDDSHNILTACQMLNLVRRKIEDNSSVQRLCDDIFVVDTAILRCTTGWDLYLAIVRNVQWSPCRVQLIDGASESGDIRDDDVSRYVDVEALIDITCEVQ